MALFIEYPDPVITRFMEEVVLLGPDEREQLVGLRAHEALRAAFLGHPGALATYAKAAAWRVWARLAFGVGCSDPIALTEYKQFLRRLSKDGWPSAAIARIAQVLLVVRMRPGSPRESQQMYDGLLGAHVPRRLIGWHLDASA